jgi:hypothetical protein
MNDNLYDRPPHVQLKVTVPASTEASRVAATRVASCCHQPPGCLCLQLKSISNCYHGTCQLFAASSVGKNGVCTHTLNWICSAAGPASPIHVDHALCQACDSLQQC